ncbi:MAG: tetratricopeptide repeat protein, partial [Pyrinomonadaceae bacterium]|nr:tetratricopeptide repeat protein [Pyrinomonadaceae bacterium]
MSSKWVSTRKGQTKDASPAQAPSGKAVRKEPSISNERFESRLMECEIKIDKGRPRSAESILTEISEQYSIPSALNIKLGILLAQTLSAQGKFDESLKTLHSIKDEDAFGDIDSELRIAFDLQKAVSLNGTGDADKAEAQLKETLRSVLDSDSDQLLGNVYVAFADVYNGQKDYKASFSYAEKGLDASRDL